MIYELECACLSMTAFTKKQTVKTAYSLVLSLLLCQPLPGAAQTLIPQSQPASIRPLPFVSSLSPQAGVREAVLRYQFHHYGQKARIYFVGGGLHESPRGVSWNAELSAPLMQRLKASFPNVRPVSQIDYNHVGYGFNEKKTGVPGPKFLIEDIEHLDKSRAIVQAEVIGGVLLATEYSYTLTYDGRNWTVLNEDSLGST